MENNTYRYAEKCLRRYPRNVILTAVLSEKIAVLKSSSDIHVQDYGGRVNSSAGYADPVNSYVHRLLDLERRLSVIERSTLPITRLQEDLLSSSETMSRHYLRILQDFYFGGHTVSWMLGQTRWSRSTFYSRRFSVVRLAAEYLGSVESKH